MKHSPLLIALLIACLFPRVLAQPTTAVVVIEGLTWEQIERGEVGTLYLLARHGAVGLMSTVVGRDASAHFALTLQTGRRFTPATTTHAPPRLTDVLGQAGVRVITLFLPPQERLQSVLQQPRSPASPTAKVQIWWLRGDLSAINREIEKAIGSLNPERDRVLIIGLPLSGRGIAPVIASGSGLSPGVLTSDTTRTRGLVSDVDIMPSLLNWHGIAPRVGEHPLRVIREDNAFAIIQQLARQCRWNAQGLIPIGALQVGGGLLVVFAVLGAIRQQTTSRRMRLLLSVTVGTLLSLPVGTVLAPYLPASTFWQYVGAIVLSALWLSLVAHWGAWEEPFRAYIRTCALSVLAILIDGISGQHGIRSSMYSAYALSGIRFYGIGNEMMGVLVGCALAWGWYGLRGILRAGLWAVVAMVLAMPGWGANLGGWLTSAAGLGAAWEAARERGKPMLVRSALWLAVGLLGALGVMWLDSLSAEPTHLGTAWLRWRTEGWQAVADAIASKLALATRVLISPFAWAVLAAIVLTFWAMRKSGMLKVPGRGWQSEYTGWLACILSAFVFNDSGFVPASAILGVGVGAVLTRRLQEAYRGSPE